MVFVLSISLGFSEVIVYVNTLYPDWTGWMNVDTSNYVYVSGSEADPYTLPATFNDSLLSLAPNTNAYNPPASISCIMDAIFLKTDDSLSGSVVTFKGYCISNTLVKPYASMAFIRDFASDYSSYVSTNVPLKTGTAFSITMRTKVSKDGRHIQYGFETIGPVANPATATQLGRVLILTSNNPTSYKQW
jgi:hypothetical protein